MIYYDELEVCYYTPVSNHNKIMILNILLACI